MLLINLRHFWYADFIEKLKMEFLLKYKLFFSSLFMPASHQRPNTLEWTYISQLGLWAKELGTPTPFPPLGPIFNFWAIIVPELGLDLVFSLDSFFQLFSWFWSITLWLVPLSFQGGESRVANAGAQSLKLPCPGDKASIIHPRQQFAFFSHEWICTDCATWAS